MSVDVGKKKTVGIPIKGTLPYYLSTADRISDFRIGSLDTLNVNMVLLSTYVCASRKWSVVGHHASYHVYHWASCQPPPPHRLIRPESRCNQCCSLKHCY